ncbi:MAG: Cell division protein FtsH (EC [uncultured Campylobacterales bacterium]|uniref:Cell division protein FtsH (EC) n=1 Tax=uncultured Campylobacterales bacterium TaxID=352960 RepID=A0A6S6T406_9BACT|nr:MAG: Cell division protein FtsH (EC [uncultured Campylobacterales bacterium]
MFNKKLIITAVSFVILLSLILFGIMRDNTKSIDFSTYTQLLQNNEFKEALIVDEYVLLKTDTVMYKVDKELINTNDLWSKVPIKYIKHKESFPWIYLAIFGVLLYYIYRYKNKIYKHSRELSKNTINQITNTSIKPIKTDTKFQDIAGIDNIKEELLEIVDFLNNPNKYKKFGVKLPRGVLFVGPPGVGKTMLASALANEANVPFYYQNGASFVQIYVGMGAKRVKELFETANKNSPAIIFIDEIDAVGKARGANRSDEREATLNQLLTQMDGFDNNSKVIVVAATNNIGSIDEALLRPGRFDRRVFVELPNLEARTEILKIYLNNKPNDINVSNLASQTSGFSGAGLATLINEAGLLAIKQDAKIITDDIINEVKDKVLLGKVHIQNYTKKEKEIQSVYLGAKVFCLWHFGFKFSKISLFEQNLFKNESKIKSKSYISNKIKVLLSGAIAQKMIFDEYYSNTQKDYEEAKKLTAEILNIYNMKEDFKDSNVLETLQSFQKEVKSLIKQNRLTIEQIAYILQRQEYILYDEIL